MGSFSSGLLLFYIAIKEASIWVGHGAYFRRKEGREVNLYGDHGARPSSQLALSSFELLSLKPPIFEERRHE